MQTFYWVLVQIRHYSQPNMNASVSQQKEQVRRKRKSVASFPFHITASLVFAAWPDTLAEGSVGSDLYHLPSVRENLIN